MSASESNSSTVAEALRRGRERLENISPSAELDAQLLLCFTLQLSKLSLVVEPKRNLSQTEIDQYYTLLDRRARHEPVAYITGTKEFWGLDFQVSPAVLVPRPDTELLVEVALTVSAEFADPLLILDLGTGSGCIPIALMFELQRRSRNTCMVALDASKEGLRLAKSNAHKHGFGDSIHFVCSDWSSAIGHDFDVVLANPPYLEDEDQEISPELKYEPQSALYAGRDGLADYRKIFKALPTLLSPKGVFLGEIGYGQAPAIQALAEELLPYPQVEFHYDLRRVQRVVEIRLPEG